MKRRIQPSEPAAAPAPPQIIAELIEAAGQEAAWTLVRAKGGQNVFIPADVNQGHWLALLVGLAAARAICKHFRVGSTGAYITIPLGRHYHSKMAMVKALQNGASANEAAEASGMHVRSAFRARAVMVKQLPLFDFED